MGTHLPFALLSAILVFALPVQAQGDWLDLGFGGRPLALGGAFTALAEGVGAAAWNPAGLISLEDLNLLAGLAPLEDLGRARLAGVGWGSGRWGMSAVYEASGADELLAGGLGLQFSELLAMGLALKQVRSAGDRALGADLGVLLWPRAGLHLGLNFVNLLGAPVLSTRTRVGVALELAWLRAAGELELLVGKPWGWRFGAELLLFKPFIVRLGLADWGNGLGLGFDSTRLAIDFSFVRAQAGSGWLLSTLVRF